MKILFDGASSFSGYWMVRALVDAGHEVFCPFSKDALEGYSGLRRKRVQDLIPSVQCWWGCRLGDQSYAQRIRETAPDLYGHHAFPTGRYKEIDYSPLETLVQVTEPMVRLIPLLKEVGCKGIVVTGSYFERGVGKGSDGLPAFSPYAACKTMAAEWLAQATFQHNLHFGRFYMPNPFGPGEERGFTTYVRQQWQRGEAASVRTPDYVRDNIPVDLLGLAYREFLQKIFKGTTEAREWQAEPSGYRGSQKSFTEKLQTEIRNRIDWTCDVEFCQQKEFTEPRERWNRDLVLSAFAEWNEETFWDRYSDFLLGEP